MSDRYIDIPNWERFQHKDLWRKSGGRPPWIKNYTQLLHKDEYMDLSQSQRGILHGLWLMYASTGRSLGEAGAKRRLCRSDAEAKWWRRNLEALRDAGFVEIVAHPTRAPDAPRVEERRVDPPSIPPAEPERLREVVQAEGKTSNGKTAAGWVENLGSYTGCRIVRGEIGISHVYDPLGTEPKPADWPYPTPSRQEILAALAERRERSLA